MIHNRVRDLLKVNEETVYWLMNINQEQVWNDRPYFPSVTDRQQLELVRQQEQQLLLLALPNEKVLLTHEPDTTFMAYLKKMGFKLPEIIVNKSGVLNPQIFSPGLLIPYIHSEETEQITRQTAGIKVFGSNYKLVKQLNNKYKVRKLMEKHGVNITQGRFCSCIDELKQAYLFLRSEGFNRCVIKIPYGSSGKGLQVIKDEEAFYNLSKFIARRSNRFELLIEGWYPTERSLNSQFLILNQQIHLLAITEQMINDHGVYLGTNFTPQIPKPILVEYMEKVNSVAKLLRSIGYTGFFGIDSIIDTTGSIFPVIEINARLTQVTYLLELVNLLQQNYKFIQSKYLDIRIQREYTFHDIYQRLNDLIPQNSGQRFIVYTFGKIRTSLDSRYRIFVVFAANSQQDLLKMLEQFDCMPSRL